MQAAEGGRRGHRQQAARLAVQFLHRAAAIRQLGQDVAGARQEALAGIGQNHLP
jgi:hypothetical protein